MKNIVMTQENKELLLKDLCARLPYGVKCKDITLDFVGTITDISIHDNMCKLYNDYGDNYTCFIMNCKPYLFPLSSMTEEQYEKFIIISGWDGDIEDIRRGKFSCVGYIGLDYIYDTIDWFLKNHFDYRGLIEKGLAIDATNLNIY